MAIEVVKRLFESFDELERTVLVAKQALSLRSPSAVGVMARLSSYEEMITKQRRLAEALCNHIASGNWDEVSRHIKLINGFSALVSEDAIHAASELGAAVAEEDEKIAV